MWANVITALITATATLTGVAITQRYAARMRQLDRIEERRVEQRDALAEVLVTGRKWTGVLAGPALDAIKPVTERGQRDEAELDRELDRLDPLDEAHRRVLLLARLTIRDERVAAHLSKLSAMADEVRLNMTQVWWSGEPELFMQHFQRIAAYNDGLGALETLTRERVVEDPKKVRRR